VSRCCGNCEHYDIKYSQCLNPEQKAELAGAYDVTIYGDCDLWEPDAGWSDKKKEAE
jgi:hypothetical protein